MRNVWKGASQATRRRRRDDYDDDDDDRTESMWLRIGTGGGLL